jgi:hypothetical protein
MHDQIAVVGHRQRRCCLLVGEESGPAGRTNGLLRRAARSAFPQDALVTDAVRELRGDRREINDINVVRHITILQTLAKSLEQLRNWSTKGFDRHIDIAAASQCAGGAGTEQVDTDV